MNALPNNATPRPWGTHKGHSYVARSLLWQCALILARHLNCKKARPWCPRPHQSKSGNYSYSSHEPFQPNHQTTSTSAAFVIILPSPHVNVSAAIAMIQSKWLLECGWWCFNLAATARNASDNIYTVKLTVSFFLFDLKRRFYRCC
jgi:hypothetical protein